MNKLTKEQAECLIERINEIEQDGYNLNSDIRSIINQCTEKEFPAFYLKTEDGASVDASLSIDDKNKIALSMNFNGVKGAVACTDFDECEFKIFTEGCNKIVSWLDEQQ